MFEQRLNAVDWSRLSHARGRATDMPECLRALAVGEQLGLAIYRLYERLCQDGIIYPASAAAVPVLLEVVRGSTNSELRCKVLNLLRDICRVWQPWMPTPGFDPSVVPDPTDDPSDLLTMTDLIDTGCVGSNRRIGVAAHFAGIRGVPDFLRLVTGGDPELRAAAAGILLVFPEHAAEADPLFRERLERESDDRRQAMWIDSLGWMWSAPPPGPTVADPACRPLPPPTVDYLIENWLLTSGRPAFPRMQAAAWVVASGITAHLPDLRDAVAEYEFDLDDQWLPEYAPPDVIFGSLLARKPAAQLEALAALAGDRDADNRERIAYTVVALLPRVRSSGTVAKAAPLVPFLREVLASESGAQMMPNTREEWRAAIARIEAAAGG